MHEVDVTFGRAMKFWWSLTWRTVLLMLPISLVTNLLTMAAVLPALEAPPDPASLPGMFGMLVPALVVGMALSVAAMVYATRWTLRTRWSDFRLLVVAPGASAPPA